MFSWLARIVSACLRPVRRYARMSKDDFNDDSSTNEDALLWCRDLEKHSCGEFSFAVVQANEVIEDHSQVETGSDAVFVGVYDGHGGPEASRFINDHLFHNLMSESNESFVSNLITGVAQENGSISEDIIRNAVSDTEDGFLTLVRRSYGIKPLIAAMGSCCLVGVIWKGTLYIANLGDSRAVIGSIGGSNKIIAEQLTREHNASKEEVRRELKSLHPEDSQIVVMKHGTWRIKGIIQVSRSIGDAYLKQPEFSFDPSFPRFHLPEPIRRPVLTAEPSVCSRVLQPNDKFIIFASDGLWEHMTNQEAAEIVHKSPRTGIARRLLRAALNEAARKREMRYKDLQKVEKGIRRFFHDDITVVVVFIDHELLGKKVTVPELSIKGFIDSVGPSNFRSFRELE
ncbi:probable protein phosphatase 2C 25 isoform X1 [Gastrolobium bilobum]|uniref:probable protein phosphatase 2C 25 isoform X1 n=1 Tax=Gastrolobium bilobum TaxID=150636 RepID=UPI002AAFEC88|nr:probable protein phosphatase 2C 25 isoform X1 [Gastrolobium bilobum]